MFYDKRNEQNLAKLADNTKRAALAWYKYCKENNINVLIYDTLRTKAQQQEKVDNGSNQTMKSYHIVGQALDFVLVNDRGECLWGAYNTPKAKMAVSYAKRLGFTWGGDWTSFVDCPHLQFNHRGYGSDTFTGRVIKDAPVKIAPKKFTSLVDYLSHNKQNSSYAARQQLAAKHGIKGYNGTAEQNTKLLNILQSA
ncbi:M15 family metallopeptidase [Lysinibacillus xylanilyticus]|uniref:M15 family metallopeptidase n=1 Tax=Lysinibacillus xylanilyticus TaxID=582475 RepID=UPI003CFFD07F